MAKDLSLKLERGGGPHGISHAKLNFHYLNKLCGASRKKQSLTVTFVVSLLDSGFISRTARLCALYYPLVWIFVTVISKGNTIQFQDII